MTRNLFYFIFRMVTLVPCLTWETSGLALDLQLFHFLVPIHIHRARIPFFASGGNYFDRLQGAFLRPQALLSSPGKSSSPTQNSDHPQGAFLNLKKKTPRVPFSPSDNKNKAQGAGSFGDSVSSRQQTGNFLQIHFVFCFTPL